MVGILNVDWLANNGYAIEGDNVITHDDGTRLVFCLNCGKVTSEDSIIIDEFDNEFCPHCRTYGHLNDCWNDNTYHVMAFMKYYLGGLKWVVLIVEVTIGIIVFIVNVSQKW